MVPQFFVTVQDEAHLDSFLLQRSLYKKTVLYVAPPGTEQAGTEQIQFFYKYYLRSYKFLL